MLQPRPRVFGASTLKGALRVDTNERCFFLNVPKDRLKDAPGFDKDNWPDMTDRTWGMGIYGFYNVTPYWYS